jgi:hypothetical protein
VSIVMGATKAADAWGAPTGSPLRAPTLDFLLVRGMAAPITVLLLVLQVRQKYQGRSRARAGGE